MNLDTKLPNLDINQLKVRLDSLYFDVNKNKLSAILISDGFGEQLKIDSKVKSKLDLAFLSNALQIPNFKLAGSLDADIVSKGDYIKKEKKFPITKGNFEIKNLCDGKCQLKISLISYEDQVIEVDTNHTNSLRIMLNQR